MTRINVNLLQVHNTFVSSLFTAHQQNADVLDGIYQEKMDRLDQYMGLLTETRNRGNGRAPLSSFEHALTGVGDKRGGRTDPSFPTQ